MKTINVANDFSKNPSGRYISDGRTSGESFLKNVLLPALRVDNQISLDFTGVRGYGSSFLEEAFGGLVRATGLSFGDFKNRIQIISDDRFLIEEIYQYLRDEEDRSKELNVKKHQDNQIYSNDKVH